MSILSSIRIIKFPKGIDIKKKAKKIQIIGPKGILFRNFNYSLFKIRVEKKSRKLTLEVHHGNKDRISRLNTISSSITNLITGVLAGFEYRMRFIYAHFPINITLTENGRLLEIRNFLGEKKVRKVIIPHGIDCIKNEKMKDELVIRGFDIHLVSSAAALIHEACLVKKKDIRKFLDGIYVCKKNIIN